MNIIFQIIAILLCYLIGAFPTAYLIVKLIKGVDIRQHGSGNVGATNVLRILGKTEFVITLIIDILKGFIPVFFLPGIFSKMSGGIPVGLVQVLCVVAVICGHNWPIFLSFKGGKGVATSTGAFFALVPYAMCFTVIVWFIVIFITKMVSAASVISAITCVILLFILKKSLIIKIFGIIMVIVLIYRHRDNIRRILAGKESKIGEKVNVDH